MTRSSSDKEKKKAFIHKWNESKIRISDSWYDNKNSFKSLHIKQGELYWCELGENLGNEQCKLRPALVISDTLFNKSGTVVVIPTTTTIKLKENKKGQMVPRYKTNYLLKKEKNPFLEKDSALMIDQIKNVTVARLKGKYGDLDEEDLQRVKTRMSTLFGLNN